MNPTLIKTLLIAGAIGFFILWVLEYLRAGIADSYWLILLSLSCLLGFQYYRIRQGTTGIPTGTKPKEPVVSGAKKATSAKRKKK